MIIRIFRIEIDPATRAAFRPTGWSPNTYALISRWLDQEALVAFAGPQWTRPVIPTGMEPYGTACSVEHDVIHEPLAGEAEDP